MGGVLAGAQILFLLTLLGSLSYSQAVLWPQASPLWAQFPALWTGYKILSVPLIGYHVCEEHMWPCA